jgi:2-dehydro-3-deoxy-D-gluconate 5-dehydrogenase
VNFGLDGHVAIVTGAGRGLGRAAVKALTAEGVRVLAVARSQPELESLQDELPGSVHAHACDLRDLRAVAALPNIAVEAMGRLDIVVNNAGIAPAGPFLDQRTEEWSDVIAVNLTAPAFLAREAGRLLVAQGSGKVINVASTSGITGKPLLVSYSASKGGLIQLTKALAAEWAPSGVQVNAIAPGAFETDAQRVVLDSPELLERRVRKIPAGRIAAPREIGPLVCLLASPLSAFVSGAVFVIDGGEVSKL